MKFKFLEHTADVKFQAFGKNLEEVFENSGLALISSQYKGKIKALKKKKIKVKGKDNESLLYNFLEEILILLEGGFLTSKIKVKIKRIYYINYFNTITLIMFWMIYKINKIIF